VEGANEEIKKENRKSNLKPLFRDGGMDH
jgi:hypothetical protein